MNGDKPPLQPLPAAPAPHRVIRPVPLQPPPADVRQLYQTLTIAYWIEGLAIKHGLEDEAEAAALLRHRTNQSIIGAI